MPRPNTLVAGALNVTIHEHHNPQTYVDLFKFIYKRRLRSQVWHDYYGIIGWLLESEKGKPETGLFGVIYRYMEIDPEQPALDIDELKPLVDGPPSIPEKYKYNLKEIYFYFDPIHHRLYFEANKISPASAHRFFAGILYAPLIQNKFGKCEINIEYSSESIKRILRMPIITGLEIYLTRPNPDDIENVEAQLFGEMDEENKGSVYEKQKPANADGLKPGNRTKAKMNLAKSYGYVWATGKDREGKKIYESTEEHPLIVRHRYQPEHYTRWQALQAFSGAIYDQIQGE